MRNRAGWKFICPNCGKRVFWSCEDLIKRGLPVCNTCDRDMIQVLEEVRGDKKEGKR